jgi:hypothetical protein
MTSLFMTYVRNDDSILMGKLVAFIYRVNEFPDSVIRFCEYNKSNWDGG